MRINRRVLTVSACLLGLASLVAAVPAPAQQEGTDYRVLDPPKPTDNPGKIEVVEFFSYACPHCAEFYPALSSWVATLPKDVVVRKVPVGFGRRPWENLQRAYYALQSSGDLPRLDGPLFAAIHQQGLPLFEEPALADWVGKNGGHADQFAAAYTSFGINNYTVAADKMAEDWTIDSVPTLVIDGKYVAIGNSHAEILANAGKLIAKVRAERAAAAPAAKKK
jgi:thiol:disulfide interchange protein DsbA